MKQTIVAKFRSSLAPLTREDVAKQLLHIAGQLMLPETPDPDPTYWPLAPNHTFEIEGYGTAFQAQIKITFETT